MSVTPEFEAAPFETLVDPGLGMVFGFAWASHVGNLLERHPNAALVADAGDIQDYALRETFGFCGHAARATFRYQLDALIAIEITWQLTDDMAGNQRIADATMRWFGAALEELDDGYYGLQSDTTRLTLDLVDQRLLLEDAEL